MSIDEQELRRRLEETATQASPPGFTAEGLARRIRRRHTRIIAVVSGAFAAAAAIAVAIPVTLSGASRPVNSQPEVIAIQLSFTVSVNGQSRVLSPGGVPGTVPRFVISPGEDLMINVAVTVPAHASVEALWLGIANGTYGGGPDGPTGVNPILAARTGQPLGPGVHRFRLQWVAPSGLQPGTSRQLAVEWAVRNGEVTRAIAELAVQRGSLSLGEGS
jgi:hypothetical protein